MGLFWLNDVCIYFSRECDRVFKENELLSSKVRRDYIFEHTRRDIECSKIKLI